MPFIATLPLLPLVGAVFLLVLGGVADRERELTLLAELDGLIEVGADLALRLAQRGGREIGRDPPLRELEAGIEDRRPDPVARLPHRRVAKPDDRERR